MLIPPPALGDRMSDTSLSPTDRYLSTGSNTNPVDYATVATNLSQQYIAALQAALAEGRTRDFEVLIRVQGQVVEFCETLEATASVTANAKDALACLKKGSH